jgi:hypothetical protein
LLVAEMTFASEERHVIRAAVMSGRAAILPLPMAIIALGGAAPAADPERDTIAAALRDELSRLCRGGCWWRK